MSNVPETTTISVDKKDVELIETTTSVENNNNNNNNEETQSKKKKRKRRQRQSASLSIDNIVSNIKKNKINCCNVFGCRGLTLILLTIAITVFQWIVLIFYTRTPNDPFARLGRPWVWVFLIIALVFTLLFVWIVIRWKAIALGTLKRNHGTSQLNRRSRRNKSVVTHLRDLYRTNIGMNGKYYLWKLYIYMNS